MVDSRASESNLRSTFVLFEVVFESNPVINGFVWHFRCVSILKLDGLLMANLNGDETREGSSNKTKENCSWALHSSDQPGMILVTSPLTRFNYLTWRQSIETSLESKEKLCFVDGSLPPPDQTDLAAYRRWKNADSMVKAWIVNSISKDLDFIYDPVSTYYGKLHKCWDELHRLIPRSVCTCSANKRNEEIDLSLKLNQFLMGLNDVYDALRSQILAMKPKPSVSEAFSMVAQMETEKEVKMNLGGTVAAEASALLANTTKIDGEQKGGKRKDNKKDLKCDHYGYNGHTRETCFKLNGYPDWWKERKPGGGKKQHANLAVNAETDNPLEVKESADLSSMISQLVRQEIAKLSSKIKTGTDEMASFAHSLQFVGNSSNLKTLVVVGTWIVDTGASSHMSYDRRLLTDVKTLKQCINVHLLDGKTVVVKEAGRAIINDDLELDNVLLIPTFKYNLLSVQRIIKGNINVVFNSSNCLVQDHMTRRILAVGQTIGNLYYLQQKVNKAHEICNSALSSSNKVVDATVVWHQRLGHAPLFVLGKTKLDVTNTLPVCDVCFKAKQQRNSFTVSTTRASDLFSLIHVHVWGPYKRPSLNLAHYVLTMADDYSKATWTFLIQNKT
ncbi:Integrase, catalytic core [Senna tora]|uniref:Integrase, catalytic core n=1 Tax=Senna tora TaxID=362788 RepID=A0A834TRP6_9FABA|nr:Integrase, catalytic core [Senna tora]